MGTFEEIKLTQSTHAFKSTPCVFKNLYNKESVVVHALFKVRAGQNLFV